MESAGAWKRWRCQMMIRGRNVSLKRGVYCIALGIKSLLIRKIFNVSQALGIHITRNHYYEPIPDTRDIKKTLWNKAAVLVGMKMYEERQLKLLEETQSKYRYEYDRIPANRTSRAKGHEYYTNNSAFEAVDGEILYSFIRKFKPDQIIEIGSGYSTYLSAKAICENMKDTPPRVCRLTAIEPFPREALQRGFPGLSALITKKVQEVPLRIFETLKENDILFIDSSHVMKIGSDVQYIIFEILPRVGKGVLIHFHDIFLPSEYPMNWIMNEHRFWNEQYVLRAFMTFNDKYEVLWSGSFMHINHPDKLERAFSSYVRTKHWPGSFWIKRVEE